MSEFKHPMRITNNHFSIYRDGMHISNYDIKHFRIRPPTIPFQKFMYHAKDIWYLYELLSRKTYRQLLFPAFDEYLQYLMTTFVIKDKIKIILICEIFKEYLYIVPGCSAWIKFENILRKHASEKTKLIWKDIDLYNYEETDEEFYASFYQHIPNRKPIRQMTINYVQTSLLKQFPVIPMLAEAPKQLERSVKVLQYGKKVYRNTYNIDTSKIIETDTLKSIPVITSYNDGYKLIYEILSNKPKTGIDTIGILDDIIISDFVYDVDTISHRVVSSDSINILCSILNYYNAIPGTKLFEIFEDYILQLLAEMKETDNSHYDCLLFHWQHWNYYESNDMYNGDSSLLQFPDTYYSLLYVS